MWKKWWHSGAVLWVVYSLAAIGIAVQRLALGRYSNGYSAYENYLIFKNSFSHLLSGQNLYGPFPAEQWDLYKYSPAFALFMAPFSVLPDSLGLPLWNLLNALSLLSAILLLPLKRNERHFIAWFVLLELITSLQNSQSNGLTAALILWTWVALDRNKTKQAGGWIAAGTFLKIFGVFAVLPAIFYENWRKTIVWGLVFGLALAAAPVVLVGPAQLVQVYQWWWELLISDHQASVGLSVEGFLQTWFGWEVSKTGITLVGLVLLGASFLFAAYRNGFRPRLQTQILAWASILIWVVIFNHKAESPTFIIALSGVALWYLSLQQKAVVHKILLAICFVLVSLSATDLFPRFLLNGWVKPYVLKAVPCILIWVLVTLALFKTPHQDPIPAAQHG
ncbi:MAG: DUF2029 domain-containing protein [Lewinellaceae bacterium]|nr:DUF2029 domain-containing protein [Lewinellaceae bacterium]